MCTARITLVPLGRVHLARTRAWANDPDVMRLMNRAQHVTWTEHYAWFENLGERRDCAYFAIEMSDARHVGNVWLWAIDERHSKAELRVVIGEHEARGQGLGAEAIDRLCIRAFDEFHLHRIYAYVLTSNVAARRSFEKAGFALEGTLSDDRWNGHQFVDTHLLARLNGTTGQQNISRAP